MSSSSEVLPPIMEGQERRRQQQHPPSSAPGGSRRYAQAGLSRSLPGSPLQALPSTSTSPPPDWQRRDIRTAEARSSPLGSHHRSFSPEAKQRRRFSNSDFTLRETGEALWGLQRHTAALQDRVQMVANYAESQQLPVVSPMDDLLNMPYSSYGPQLPKGPNVQPAHSTTYGKSYAIGFCQPVVGGPATVADVYESQVPSLQTSRANTPSPAMTVLMTRQRRGDRPLSSSVGLPARPSTSAELYTRTLPGRTAFASPPPRTASGPGAAPGFTPAAGPGPWRTGGGGMIKETMSEMDAVLMRMHYLISASDNRERQDIAVLVIQRVFRGWAARKRYAHARWAMRAWRRQELAAVRQRLLEWVRIRQAQEEYIYMVRKVQARDLTRLAFRAWMIDIQESRRALREKDDRAAQLSEQLLRQRGKDMLRQWLEVATGPRSRKACSQRYTRRCAEAKTRLMVMAEEMGWTGNITDDMIKRELENEAVNTVVTSSRRRVMGGVLGIWVRFARLRRIAKGKHLESDRKYHKVIINKCFKLWQKVVHEKMAEWKGKGWDFSRRRLWAVARREGRRAVMRWSLRFWMNRVRLHGRLNVFMKVMMSKSLAATFRGFRDRVMLQRTLKRNAVERWQLISRDKIAYPFRCWIKFAAMEKTATALRMKAAGGMLYRYRQRLVLRCFHAFRIALEASKYTFDFSPATEEGVLRFSPRGERGVGGDARQPGTPAVAQDDDLWDEKLESLLSPSGAPSSPGKKESLRPITRSPTRSRRARYILGEEESEDNLLGESMQKERSPAHSHVEKPEHRTQPERQSGSLQPAARFPGTSDLYAQMRATESVDRVVRSLESNLEIVFDRPLLDMESEAARLRIFLEMLEDSIANTRENMVSDAAAFGMEDAIPASPTKSSQNRRRTSRHSDGGMSVEVGAPSTTGGPRKARTPKTPKSGKSTKSVKGVKRSMSRHQKAFFKGMKMQEIPPPEELLSPQDFGMSP